MEEPLESCSTVDTFSTSVFARLAFASLGGYKHNFSKAKISRYTVLYSAMMPDTSMQVLDPYKALLGL